MIRAGLFLCGLAAVLLAGVQPLTKLALLVGLPGLAAGFPGDPALRGVALYLAGDHAGADAAFQTAGRGSTYNRGLSLAATGDLPLARAYFDAVLFANPADSEARDNRNLVNALIPPHQGAGNAAGRIAATAIAAIGGSPVSEVKRLGRPLEEGRRVADAEWLVTLPDDPGEFLRLRLAEEHRRRLSLGLIPPEEGTPW